MSGTDGDGRSTRSSSAPGPTGSPRPSRWPAPDGRSGSTRPPTTLGGGTRTAELTLPGFRHDVCSTILPLTIGLALLPLDRPGGARRRARPSRRPVRAPARRWRAAVLERSVAATADGLGRRRRSRLAAAVRAARPRCRPAGAGAPRPVVHVPRHPLALARFGLPALRSASGLARGRVPRRARPGRCSPGSRPTRCSASTAR